MQIEVDSNAKAVLEFMQTTIPSNQLLGVAEVVPQLARLLWGKYPQEPCVAVALTSPKKDQEHLSQSASIVFSLE